MELLSLKIIVLTLSGVVRLVFGMMPMVLMKCLTPKFRDTRLKRIIGFLMFFGGGVLLATCFLHMMPEVRESFRCALPQTEFPVAEIIFLGGFFLVYMLEDIIHTVIDRRRRNPGSKKEKNLKKQTTKSKTTMAKKAKHLSIADDTCNSSHHNNMERSFQANINGAYQSNGDITAKPCTNPFPPHRQSSIEDESPSTVRALPYQQQHHHNHHQQNGDVPPAAAGPGAVSVLPRIRPSDYANQINNMKNDHNLQPPPPPRPISHFGGTEKFSYVDPDWWRDTVIANSQMNLLSTSSFSVASSTGGGGGGHEIGLRSSAAPEILSDTPQFNHHLHHHHNNNSSGQSPEGSQIGSSGTTSSGVSSDHHNHHHSHSHGHSHCHLPLSGDCDDESVAGSIRGIVIVIAISFHGIFEGLAIGLQSTAKDVWYLFLAVSLHECTILFCIGVELISSKTKPIRMITYILVVSLVSPVGTAMGILISEESFKNGATHAIVIGSFQGLAAGTLLYVTFFEIFASEGKNLKTKSVHILVAILGFVLMASLELLGEHSHTHSHCGSKGLNGTHDHNHLVDDDHLGHNHDEHQPALDHGHDHGDHDHDHDHSH